MKAATEMFNIIINEHKHKRKSSHLYKMTLIADAF